MEHKTIQDYLETVAQQMRWKRARPVVVAELKQHLEDQRDSFVAKGCENAEQLAVEEMGDPVIVGTELDCIHRPKPQYGLLLFTILFALTGVLLRVWLTASWEPYNMNIDPQRTVLAWMIGVGALLCGYFLDYARLGLYGRTVYVVALVISIGTLMWSPRIMGASYYTRYVTLLFPVVYAFWLYTCRRKGWIGLLLALAGGIPLPVICLQAPYLFGLLTLLLTGFVLLVAAAWSDWFGIGRRNTLLFVMFCTIGMVAITFLSVFSSGYATERLSILLHPELDPLGRGYQACMIQEVLGVSQWFGEGTVEGSQYPFELQVPGCDSDAFLTTLIYKLGWLPFLLLILLFVLLVVWLLYRCIHQKSQLGKWVVLSVVSTLSMQALCSVTWNLGYTFYDSSFPLIVGNLNMIINMWMIGLVLSVFRAENIARDDLRNKVPSLPRYHIKIELQKY